MRPKLYRFLTWIERIFKIDAHYLAKGTFWSSLAQVVITLSTLALSVVLAEHLPKEVYGQYKFVLSLVSTIGVFSLSSLNTAVLQSTSRGFDGALQEGFIKNLKWSFAMFAGALAIGGYYLVQGNLLIGIGVLIGGTLSPLIASSSLASSFLIAKKDFEGLVLNGSIIGSFIPAAALMLVALYDPTPLLLVLVYFICTAGVYLYLFIYTVRKYRPNPRNTDPGMMQYAKHLSVIGVVAGLAANIDQLLLFHYVGAVPLALYNFAIGIPEQLKGPMKNIDSMLQARFANYPAQEIRANMRQKTWLLAIFGVLCTAIYIPLAPYVFALLFPAYLDAVPYTQLYSLIFLSYPFAPSMSYLAAKRLIKEQYLLNLINSVLRIVFVAVGVIGFGLYGLVCAIVMWRFTSGIVGYTLYRRASAREGTISAPDL